MAPTDIRPWMVRRRILVSRFIIVLFVLLVLLSHHSWEEPSLADFVMEISGIFLVMAGTFIRIYSAVFIYGRKTTSLIAIGPYSVVRNPLYVGSLIAGLGIGLESENLLIIALIVVFFVAYYPFIILDEEHRLREVHGAEFDEYCKRVPRFIPNFSLFHEPDTLEVNTKKLKWAFIDGLAFVAGALTLVVVEALHELQLVPILFTVP